MLTITKTDAGWEPAQDVDMHAVTGRLVDLWQQHVAGGFKLLNRNEAGLLASWQKGELKLTGKALDQALQILESHGKTASSVGHSDAEPQLLRMVLVYVEHVQVEKRFRRVDEVKARALAASIQENGKMLQPIGISQDNWLVYGAHRLRAAEILGWKEIPAIRLPYRGDDDRARVDELDENLRRNELTPLEISRALAARKEAYERLHPATKRGVKGGRPAKARPADQEATQVSEALDPPATGVPAEHVQAGGAKWKRPDGKVVEVFKGLGKSGWMAGSKSPSGGWHRVKSPKLGAHRTQAAAQKELDAYAAEKRWEQLGKLTADSAVSFTADAAAKTGMAPRTIREAVALAKAIPDDVAESLEKAERPATASELKALAKLDTEMQRSVAKCIEAGEARTVTEALRDGDEAPKRRRERDADQDGALNVTLDEMAASPEKKNASGDRMPQKAAVVPGCETPADQDGQAGIVLKRLLEQTKDRWLSICGDKEATAQLGAGVLESVAWEWVTQDWHRKASRKPK